MSSAYHPLGYHRGAFLLENGFQKVGEVRPFTVYEKGIHQMMICENCVKAVHYVNGERVDISPRTLYLELKTYFKNLE